MAETTLYNQDCIAAMQQIGAESIDLIVTEANATKKDTLNLYNALILRLDIDFRERVRL